MFEPFALIENPTGHSWLFEQPEAIIRACTPDELPVAFAAMETAKARGRHLVGHVAYEAGFAFEAKLAPLYRAPPGPLLEFGVFGPPRAFDLASVAAQAMPMALEPLWRLEDYAARFAKVQDYLLAGDIYQANLTFPLRGHFSGDALALFAALRARQKAKYAAFIALGEQTLLSLSPELFFEIENGVIRARPMKGTAPRGVDAGADATAAEALRQSEKNRAENLMIVDLLRNDLGRLAEIGSVRVSDLFSIETYPTLFQMTSGIEARLREGLGLAGIFAALFPCGSVTGAPKIRAMEIVRALEAGPRGAYCGAIGHIAPHGDCRFNVAIRTLVLDGAGGVTLNVGSGVVHDSKMEEEYDECLLKAQFLTGNSG